MYEGDDYTIRTSPKTFINEMLFIHWLRTVFLLWNDDFRRKCQYEDPMILSLDGNAATLFLGRWDMLIHREF
jgi:hypothetical protein